MIGNKRKETRAAGMKGVGEAGFGSGREGKASEGEGDIP